VTLVAVVFAIVYLGMILGGLPFLQLDRTGIALADGRPANRAGCRLFGPPGDIEDLVRRFLAELGE
jgi:hypothetical protein